MSNRQARRARKARQRAGIDAFVHLGPTQGTRPYESRDDVKRREASERRAQIAATSMLRGWMRPLEDDA